MEYLAVKQSKGATLIELVVVIAILLILSVGSIYSGAYLVASIDLNTSTHAIETALETARDYTLNHYSGSSTYGVSFSSTSYKVYKGTTYSGSNTVVLSGSMPIDVTLTNISFNGNTYVYFQSVTGLPSNTGSLKVHTIAKGDYTVSITTNGIINIVKG